MSTAAAQKTSVKKNPAFRLAMIAVAALVVAFTLMTPAPEGLAVEGWVMLGIVVGTVILLISEAMPMAAACFMIIIVRKYTGVMKWKEIQQAVVWPREVDQRDYSAKVVADDRRPCSALDAHTEEADEHEVQHHVGDT